MKKELAIVQKCIERIHETSLDVLSSENLTPQVRKELTRIAEEALELCRMIGVVMSKNSSDANLIRKVWSFFCRVVPFLSGVADDEN